MRFRKLLAIGLVAAVGITACSSSDDASKSDGDSGKGGSSSEPIRIGMLEDSTGPGASYAVVAGDTVRDLVKKINDEGGVLDRKLELIVDSDASDSTQTATVTRRLIDKGADVLLMITTNAGTVQTKPVFNETKTVAISPVALLTDIAEPPDHEFSYILANPTSDQAEVFIGAFKKLGVKKLAIFNDAVPGMVALTDTFIPAFEKAGIKVVAREEAATDAPGV
ncbi:MAG TPA: ABC transporter substrate-binding protein, partial [Microthrixaceae bacterium]|nr:ABC transporter substrate-binding protein [Microthrixaceae bacterium]